MRRTLGGQYSFLIVTDRLDLDAQIAGTFAHCDVIADARAARIPDSAAVQDRLKLDLRVQFALVQKFKRFAPEGFTDKMDLIVLSDEVHRTQYGALAWNMRRALPKAKFLGFTGTPLIFGYHPGSAGAHAVRGKVTGGVQDAGVARRFS